jgi:hypothetical protein
MDIRERHFGPIVTCTTDGHVISVNLDALIKRILLFDHCYLESNLLREIPAMAKTFGYSGLMRLLEDPHFQIISDALTAGSVGQTAGLQIASRRG